MSTPDHAKTTPRAKVALSSIILAMTLVGVLVAGMRVASQTAAEEEIGTAAALGMVVGGLAAALLPGGTQASRPRIAGVGRFVFGALIGGPAGGLAVAPHAFPTLVFGGLILIAFAVGVRRFSARRPASSQMDGGAG